MLLDSRLVEETRYDNLYSNIHYDPAQQLYRCWYNPALVDPMKSKTPPEKRTLPTQNSEEPSRHKKPY